jgi:hypothetical protein
MLKSDVVLLHDDAQLLAPALPEHFNWELFDHSPHSSDLALNDYHPCNYQR